MNQRRAYQARYVFPVDGPPIERGILTVADGRVVAVGPTAVDADVEDLGNVAIVPGFVNAHTHLEFSAISQPLGTPGMPLPDWIRSVVEWRRSGGTVGPADIARGLAESLAAGTTTIGDIVTSDRWREGYDVPLRVTLFRELLGLPTSRKDGLMWLADEHCQSFGGDQPHASTLLPGLSPHAPYSCHPRVMQRAVALSRKHKFPLALHLAESQEELQLLQSQDGPFLDLLQDLNAWEPDVIPTGTQPLDYLAILASAQRSLVIHGNYLSNEEIAFLAERAERMSVVYCPRTHEYFRHNRYPLWKMICHGVQIAIGTDSRASNPDLSLFQELRYVAAEHPEVPFDTILQLGTVHGARALGLDHLLGTLSPGKVADFVAIRLSEQEAADPHLLLLLADTRVDRVWVAGEVACVTG